MSKWCIVYNIINKVFILIGLGVVASLNKIICLIIISLYTLLYLVQKPERNIFYRKNYVEKEIFNELYDRYKIYQLQNLDFDSQLLIDEMDSNNPNFDEELEEIYFFTK